MFYVTPIIAYKVTPIRWQKRAWQSSHNNATAESCRGQAELVNILYTAVFAVAILYVSSGKLFTLSAAPSNTFCSLIAIEWA